MASTTGPSFVEACSQGDIDSVQKSLINLSVSTESLSGGLTMAVLHDQVPVVKYLLENGASLDDAVFLAAARTKSLPVYKLLLEHGWDINRPLGTTTGGETALILMLDNPHLVKWLFANGAELVPVRHPATSSAAMAAVKSTRFYLDRAGSVANIEIFDLLLQHGATKEGSVALHFAAGASLDIDRLAIMSHLISIGFNVNGTDHGREANGQSTPLHYAIKARSLERANLLLQHGAEPHRVSTSTPSPIQMAKASGFSEFVSLVEHESENTRMMEG